MTTPTLKLSHWLVVIGVAALPLIWLWAPGTGDTKIFLEWMQTMLAYGPIQGFTELHRDYPPLTPLVLWLVGLGADSLHISYFLAYKLSIIVSSWCIGLIAWYWSKQLLPSVLLYLGLIINSAMMGYSDVYLGVALIVGLWLLRQQRWFWSTLLFSLVMFIKWTPLVLGPLLLLYVGYQTYHAGGIKKVCTHNLLPTILVLVGMSVFGYTPIHDAWVYATHHTFLSGNAFNSLWLLTAWLHWRNPLAYGGLDQGVTYIQLEDPSITNPLRMVFYLIYFGTVGFYLFKKSTYTHFLLMSTLAALGYFLFNLGVHENHLFIAVLLAWALAMADKRYWPLAVGVGVAFNLNLLAFLGELRSWRVVLGFDLSIPLALLNVLGWISAWLYYGLPDTDWYKPLRMFRRIVNTSRKLR